MTEADSNAKVVAGIVAAVLGVSLLVYFVGRDDKEGANTSCTLTATGVTAIAVGLSRSSSSQAIIATAGPALGSVACREVVDSLVEQPGTPVEVEIDLGSPNAQSTTVVAGSFLPPLNDEQTCFDWIDATLELQCLQGRISPPPF